MPTPAPEFVTLLSSLKNGEQINPRHLDAFMDLHRDERAIMTAEWTAIPAEKRLELMDLAANRAAADILADFTALGSVAMVDDDPRVRRFAIEMMAESEDWRVADALLAALNTDPDPIVRVAAAISLGPWALQVEGEFLDTKQGESIIGALRNAATNVEEADEVRSAAILAAALTSESFVDSLINDFYYDESRELRLAAVQAMGVSGSEDWLDFLDEQLQSDDPDFRRAAVTSVGELMIESTIDSVAALLVDDDFEVVLAAIGALGEIGGGDAIGYLSNFLEEAEPELIEAIEEAIAEAQEPWKKGVRIEGDNDEDSDW